MINKSLKPLASVTLFSECQQSKIIQHFSQGATNYPFKMASEGIKLPPQTIRFSKILQQTVCKAIFKGQHTSYYLKSKCSSSQDSNHEFCFQVLNKVSRSFSFVISQLPPKTKLEVCIFYLTLRALDSIEDSTSIITSYKKKELNSFYHKLYQNGSSFQPVGKPSENELLEQFSKVQQVFQQLKPESQLVISDITKRMGEGMAKYAGQTKFSYKEYDEYCYIVAGMVGEGLTQLFNFSSDEKIEDPNFLNSIAMGKMLQKANIIRDFHEDINEDRVFWPRDIAQDYYNNDIKEFLVETQKGVNCLNHLIADALSHLPQCLKYLSQLKNQRFFKFCALPQIMALATLNLCINNKEVFQKSIKITKGETAVLAIKSGNYDDFCDEAQKFIDNFLVFFKNQNTSYSQTAIEHLEEATKIICKTRRQSSNNQKNKLNFLAILSALFGIQLTVNYNNNNINSLQEDQQPLQEVKILSKDKLNECQMIVNWDEVISQINDPSKQSLVKLSVEKMKEMNYIITAEQLEMSKFDKKEQIQLYTLEEKGKPCIVIGEGMIEASSEQLFEIVSDNQYRKLYDNLFTEGFIQEVIAPNTYHIYQKYKRIFPVQARDFSLILHCNKEPSGMIKIVVFSHPNPQAIQINSICQRGQVYIGGWIFQPMQSNKCKVTYIAQVDSKGNLPEFIQKYVNKQQIYQIARLRNATQLIKN